MDAPQKTTIGVVTTHEDTHITEGLVELLQEFCREENAATVANFQFIFTGGSFDRIVRYGHSRDGKDVAPVDDHTRQVLLKQCGVARLPGFKDGGVTLLSYFITQRLCSIIWQLYSGKEYHWRRPENLAQLRLCDQWHVKRLTNLGSVRRWFYNEATADISRNLRPWPPKFTLRSGADDGEAEYRFWPTRLEGTKYDFYEIKELIEKHGEERSEVRMHDIVDHVRQQQDRDHFPKEFERMTIALIAHDEMKERMISFAIDHEPELAKFGNILATGTTGREVAAATSKALDKKIYRYHSGPKGGDIEIATEILLGRCHVVIFFVDPLHPHPHIDDIRAVYEACMAREDVVMITNEMHALDFMNTVVRPNTRFKP